MNSSGGASSDHCSLHKMLHRIIKHRGPLCCDCCVSPNILHLSLIADVIAGGAERWSTLSEGRTSDQLVDVLLEDLGAGLLRERETFVGKVC